LTEGLLERAEPGRIPRRPAVGARGTVRRPGHNAGRDDDQGHYTWVAEPAVTAEGPRLLMHEAAHCPKLDRAALDEIVDRVDRWYHAFFNQIAVQAS
jgi:hypothetical protein